MVFQVRKLQHVTIASSISCRGDAAVACVDFSAFEMLLFPIERQQHVGVACSNSCCGDGPVGCSYFDAFEMLVW